MISASKLELGILCPSAFALAHKDVRVQGSDPERGKEEHAENEAAMEAGDVPEDLEARWPGYTWQAEVKVRYDIANDVGTIIGRGSDRAYGTREPFVVPGTIDALGISPDRTNVAVVDYKGFNEQTPAYRNPQVSVLALAVTRALGVRAADVAIRPKIGGMDVARLEALDLDAFADDVRNALTAVARAQEAHKKGLPLEFTEGRHCTYCPAYNECPRKQALALMLKGEPALRLDLANDNDAADAYEFARKIGELLKRLNGAIYARAAERPIPLPDGRVLAKVTEEGNEKLDGDIVWRIVADKFGRDIADTAVVRSATKVKLKEALRFAGVKSVAAAEREVLELVRSAGGAPRKESTNVKVVPAARLLKAGGE